MDVKFNSGIGFGAKRVPSATLIQNYKKTHTTVDPFSAEKVMAGFDHNSKVIEGLPQNILQAALGRIYEKGLRTKPAGFDMTSKSMKPVLQNLVNDTTEIGNQSRSIVNRTAIKLKSKPRELKPQFKS